MNVQFAIKDGDIYVLEVNPRASRTVPFVAKAIGLPVAAIAAAVMAGKTLADFGLKRRRSYDHVAVKEAVFPFARFPGVDTILGPEMRSTGEVMGLDRDFAIAPSPRASSAAASCCRSGHRVRLGEGRRQGQILEPVRELVERASRHGHARHQRHLEAHGITCERSTRCSRAGPTSSTR